MKYYAVKKGRIPGIYLSKHEYKKMTDHYPGAVGKAFKTKEEAEKFLGIWRNDKNYNGNAIDFKRSMIFGSVLLVITLVAIICVYCYAKQEKEKVADEYKAEGYIICKSNDLNQYAISKDELEKYKNKAETVTLYTLPDKKEIVKKTNTTYFKLLEINDIQSLYRKEDCYTCKLTTTLEHWGAISKTEYKRYKNGDSFYMTVFYENKNRAELIDTSTINSIQKD